MDEWSKYLSPLIQNIMYRYHIDWCKIAIIKLNDVATLGSYYVSFFYGVRKMEPRPIYFGFWCLMINTTKLD